MSSRSSFTSPVSRNSSGVATPLSEYSPDSPASARSSQYALDLASDADTYSRKLTSHPSSRLSDFAKWLQNKSDRASARSSDPDDFRSRLDPSHRQMLSLGAARPVIDELTASSQSAMVDELHARLRSVIDSPPHSTQWSDRPPSYAESVRHGSPPSYISPLSTGGTRSTTGRSTADTASDGTCGTNGLPTPRSSRRSSGSSSRRGGGWMSSPRARTRSPSPASPARLNTWTWAGLSSSSSSATPPISRSISPTFATSTSNVHELADDSSARSSFRSSRAPSTSDGVELPSMAPRRAIELDATSQPSRYPQRQQYIEASPSRRSGKIRKAPLTDTQISRRHRRRENLLGRLARVFRHERNPSHASSSSRLSRRSASSFAQVPSTGGWAAPSARRRLNKRPASVPSNSPGTATHPSWHSTSRSGTQSTRSLPNSPTVASTWSSPAAYPSYRSTPTPTDDSNALASEIAALTYSMNTRSCAQSSRNLLRLHAEHARSPNRTADSLWTAHTADTVRLLNPRTLRRLASLSEQAGRSGVTYNSMSEFAATGSVVPFYRGQERLRRFKRAWTEATRSGGAEGVEKTDVDRLIEDLGRVKRELESKHGAG